jgi:radical SAM superfamily enzyme YgiQ (UPF0313 family)
MDGTLRIELPQIPLEIPRRPKVDMRVWLADLTYTQQSIASEIMPQAIGFLATYAGTQLDFRHPIKLFKYPERLAEALAAEGPPDLIGFSHYIWNSELSLAFARRIKAVFPDVIVVFGGPHYPVLPSDQETFLRKLTPPVDAYVDREGEVPFAALVGALSAAGGSFDGLHGTIPGVHTVDPTGTAHVPKPGTRLRDLTGVPSPYVSGALDEFFDGRLIPTIQTNRGCPFSCSFCVEGTSYYSKVAKKEKNTVRDEIDYIGRQMRPLVQDPDARNELLITDSNFGMFLEDLDTCDAVVESQDTYGWPKYIDLTTGKNKRDRVIEAISRTRGMMTLSGSVQSLDMEVLKSVRRANIDATQLMEVALAASQRGTGTYSEVILGLPNDSKAAHFATLDKLIEAGFDRLNMFQLALLPGSDLWSGEQREQYDMVTRYRVVPRCFGRYEVLGEELVAAEIDEICVTLPTLPFNDYLDCRQMNLMVSVCYNDGTLEALVKMLRLLGCSVFEWLDVMQRLDRGQVIDTVLKQFREDSRAQLWESREDLARHAATNVDGYISGDMGNNLLYTYRARILGEALDDLVDLARRAAKVVCGRDEALARDGLLDSFIDEAAEFHRLRLTQVLEIDAAEVRAQQAAFDVQGFITEPRPLAEVALDRPVTRRFVLTEAQVGIIRGYLRQYGDDWRGAGRMLTKIQFPDLFRKSSLSDE